jgi:cytochrome c biogenesis protein
MNAAKEIYRIISSMKTGLILLILIALVSAAGSVVFPSGFFNTIVFKLLLLLLLLNMALCTINRVLSFKSTMAKIKNKKGLFRQMGILFLHAGIVFILVGGVVFSFYGESEEVSISTGETVDLSDVMNLDKSISFKLNSFKIEINEDGSPSQYYSDVTVLLGGKTQGKELISVNHPLKVENIKAYQESYGTLVKARNISGSTNGPEKLYYEGDSLKIPNSKRTVKVYKYFSDFDPTKGMNQTSLKEGNPRVVYSVYEDDKLLGVGAAKFGSKIEIDDGQYVEFSGIEPYTVLKVKSDPGLSLVLIGSLLFMIGVSLALFVMPVRKTPDHRQQEKTAM